MTKKRRAILFLSCLFLFLLIAPSVIFYSQGYRVDFNPPAGGIKIVQTGGIFLKVEPKQATVFVDEKSKKKTDFLFGTILIKNLLPGWHKIRVEKDGFHPWEKNLEIKEKEVAEAKNIILIPQNPNFTVLTQGINNFWFSLDGKKIIFLRAREQEWELFSYEIDKGVENYLIKEKDIGEGVEIDDLKFSSDQKEIILETKIKPASAKATAGRDDFKKIILDISRVPPILTNATTSPAQILEQNLGGQAEDFLVSQKINGESYELDNSGKLFKNGGKLSEMSFKTIKISPNFQKLALIQDYEIWLLFIEPQSSQPQRKANEQIYLTRFSKKIGEVFWYNSDYLLFNVGGEIKITEIDNRDRLNIADLISFTPLESPPFLTGFKESEAEKFKIFFDQNNKKLYILNKGNFSVSEKLLP
ncbi:hypothetical protein KKH59_05170 [Patescibacteria group bacterium]|nr:hypothetical protein [Patescibacteria group bacterium]